MKVEEIKLAFDTNVKLALIDDIKQSANLARSLKEKIESNFSLANGGLRAVSDFNKSYSDAVAKAKEVGFPIPSELIKLTDLIKSYEDFFNKVKAI